MKRLLGGERMKWAHPVTKHWLTGLAVIVLGLLGSLLVAQQANAAPATSAKWLNRMYLVGSNNHNYFDENTYDNNFTYVERDSDDGCPDAISYVYTQDSGADVRNNNFFYRPLSNAWRVEYHDITKYTAGSGQQVCGSGSSGGNGFKVTANFPISDFDNRRVMFYKTSADKIVGLKANVTFSRGSDWKGIARYYRDDEVNDTNNSCPDIILDHKANINTGGETIFGRGEVAGSSMLYAVRKDDELGRKAESYDRISEPNAISKDTCRIEGDSMNGRKNGHYGIASHEDNDADGFFLAGGLQDNGAPATGGDEADDAIIIFVGTEANVPKDPSGAPISNPGSPNGGGNKTNGQTCKGGALGWIICPLVSAIQTAIDQLRDIMQYFLTVDPLPIGSGPVYDAWNNIRNIANIAFAIAFFAIIFSQATSVGISNYGIKRLLPRLVLIAVATNLSYFVCSFLVDFFNILGVGITNLLTIANGGAAGTVEVSNTAGAIFTAGITTAIIWAFATGAIVQIFPLLAAAFIGFLVTVVILVARQALLILLVVFSPIAFVAALLPGTQGWFRRWFDLFTTLLFMYPLIMGLFAIARIAGSILSQAAG